MVQRCKSLHIRAGIAGCPHSVRGGRQEKVNNSALEQFGHGIVSRTVGTRRHITVFKVITVIRADKFVAIASLSDRAGNAFNTVHNRLTVIFFVSNSQSILDRIAENGSSRCSTFGVRRHRIHFQIRMPFGCKSLEVAQCGIAVVIEHPAGILTVAAPALPFQRNTAGEIVAKHLVAKIFFAVFNESSQCLLGITAVIFIRKSHFRYIVRKCLAIALFGNPFRIDFVVPMRRLTPNPRRYICIGVFSQNHGNAFVNRRKVIFIRPDPPIQCIAACQESTHIYRRISAGQPVIGLFIKNIQPNRIKWFAIDRNGRFTGLAVIFYHQFFSLERTGGNGKCNRIAAGIFPAENAEFDQSGKITAVIGKFETFHCHGHGAVGITHRFEFTDLLAHHHQRFCACTAADRIQMSVNKFIIFEFRIRLDCNFHLLRITDFFGCNDLGRGFKTPPDMPIISIRQIYIPGWIRRSGTGCRSAPVGIVKIRSKPVFLVQISRYAFGAVAADDFIGAVGEAASQIIEQTAHTAGIGKSDCQQIFARMNIFRHIH